MTDFSNLLAEHQRQQARVGMLRELIMAHQAYKRSVEEFGNALGIDMDDLNYAQAAAVFDLCNETDSREVSGETLVALLTQLEELK